jgi:hypothetical protein
MWFELSSWLINQRTRPHTTNGARRSPLATVARPHTSRSHQLPAPPTRSQDLTQKYLWVGRSITPSAGTKRPVAGERIAETRELASSSARRLHRLKFLDGLPHQVVVVLVLLGNHSHRTRVGRKTGCASAAPRWGRTALGIWPWRWRRS